MERNILARAAEFLKKSTRHKRWRRALTGMAAVVVFITSYMMILPAITMSVNQGALPPGVDLNADPDYTAELTLADGSVVTIGVYDPDGNVPEGAVLVAELFEEGGEDYLKAEETLLNSEDVEPYDGMLAMDLHFEDAEGNEVEPTGSVYVDMEADALLPVDVDPDSVAVQHHVELDADRFFGLVDGSETTVEVVADGSENTGDVVVDPTESPAPSETPAVTETPDVTETPETTESPEVTESPEATESPEVTEPVLTETPAEGGEVDLPEETIPTTDAPATDSPEASTLPELPESPEPPVATEEPVVSTLPELPSEPVAPVEPEIPVEPEPPAEPETPAESTTEPVESAGDGTAVEATFAVDSFSTFTITWNVLEEVPEEPELVCGLEEHSHFEDCYDADGNLICTLEEHTHSEDCYAVELPEEEIPMGAFPEELPEGYMEYRFENEDGLSVLAYAPENAFDGQEVTLFAEVLAEESDAYTQAAENLANAGTEYTGMMAMDIRFQDADGSEVEPNAEAGPVYVDIQAEALLPEDVDTSTLAVQHHAEIPDGGFLGTGLFAGTEVTVETVADANTETGTITAVPVEAAIPETLPALADEPMSEEIATLEEPAEEETEELAAVPMNVEASFGVESFSTFTITWSGYWGGTSTVTVHYITEDGNEIYSGQETDIPANGNVAIDLRNYAVTIEGFRYQGIHLNTVNGTSAIKIRYNSNKNKWEYSNNSWRDDWGSWYGRTVEENHQRVTYYDVYIVYEDIRNSIERLTTVDTVDSTAKGVHMYMRNFNGKAFGGGEYYPGDVKEGLASQTVNGNGWPTLTGASDTPNGKSFAEVFFGNSNLNAYNVSNDYAVNELFLQSEFDTNGTFYYSSFENFATLKNDGDKNFTVYEQLGTPNAGENYFYQRGNFMPYNTLNIKDIANYNLYDDTGAPLTEEDERVNEPVYGLNEKADFHFGMYIWADFYQPQNGMVEDNEGGGVSPMIFEFTGDDDMWVYIDGVLVLDLGGIHDAQSGSINFTDGTIEYTDTQTNQTPVWHSTTLKAQYEAAGKTGLDWKGDTFIDGSNHRIQIFYMERGEGASNLKISFNLKTIPDGQLAVSKNVEHYYAPQLADTTYTMKVTVNDKPYANEDYTIYGTEQTGKTDSNGQFELKHDQTALFPDLTVGNKVTVKEVGTSDTEEGVEIEQNYGITYTVTDGGGNIIGGVGEDGTVTATMPGYGSIKVDVTNTATFTRPLKLVKNFVTPTGSMAPEGFQATYTLYEVTASDNIEIGSVRYSDLKNGEYTFWLDTGKDYTIVETFDRQGDNKAETVAVEWLGVSTTTNDPATGTQPSAGIVHLDENDTTEGESIDTIILTNRYGEPAGNLSITKKVERTDGGPVDLDSIFNFTVTVQGADGSYNATYTNETSGGKTHEVNNVMFSEGEATVELYAGETVKIEGLPSNVKATIEEINYSGYAPEWSNTEANSVEGYNDIESTAVGTVTTKQISASNEIKITCTNTTGAVLPSTGGMGVAPYLTFGSLLTLGAGLLLLQRRREEGSDAA